MKTSAHEKNYRNNYIIGDVHGCFDGLQQLLAKVDFDETQDCLWFLGDLVARGDKSLQTLRFVKRLNERGHAFTILGNHDIHLLATWRGFVPVNPKDKTEQILQADDCDELMHWLRAQPLMLQPNNDSIMVHAGIPPVWNTTQAMKYVQEVEQVLSSDMPTCDDFLQNMYEKKPNKWDNSLQGFARLRIITNYLTRMRLCTQDSELEFSYKQTPWVARDMPTGYKPWYEWDNQFANQTIYFGHWSALMGQVQQNKVHSLDAGYLWGGQLMAFHIESSNNKNDNIQNKRVISVQNPS